MYDRKVYFDGPESARYPDTGLPARCNVGQNHTANIFIFKVFFICLIFIYIGFTRFMLYLMFLFLT